MFFSEPLVLWFNKSLPESPDGPQMITVQDIDGDPPEDEDCEDDQSHDQDDMRVCQSKDCINKTLAIRVCHHPECTESNSGQPFLMCRECDRRIHGNPAFSSHLVLDAPKRKIGLGSIGRGASTPNLKVDDEGSHSDMDVRSQGDGSVDGEDSVDGIFIKKREVHEFRPPPTPTSTELKLKRKKALKQKRRHTDAETLHSSNELFTSETDDDSDIGDKEIRRKSDDLHNGSITQRALRRQSKSVISDECFTLRFMDAKENEIEIVAATRGISLRAALQPILERRGIGINNVNIFVEASKTPLPLECESFLLGGNTLRIKEKESDGILGRSTTSRQNSGNKSSSVKNSKSSGMSRRESFFGRASTTLEQPLVKQRRNSLSIPFFSNPAPKVGDGPRMLDDNQPVGSLRSRRGINLSIDDTIAIPNNLSSSVSPQGTISYSEGRRIKDRSKLQNLFSPMGSKDRERHEQLSELLNTYSNSGIPPMPELLSFGKQTYDEKQFEIEPHWSSIVENASSLTKRQHDQQEAIWELLTTEIQYIRTVKVITDLFMCCLINLQSESLLNEIDTVQMFSNINDILNVNCDFWEKNLLKVLQESRESRLPFNPSNMKEGFKKFPELFVPYTKYCEEQKPSSEYMKARYSDNDLFKTFVVWAETQKQCNRLKLTDLLVKPMQRLTKYSLLLQAILRKTEDDRQRKDLLEMIGSVDKFVAFVNSTMRQKYDRERLATIVAKIESYDAVESPNDECLKYLQEYYDNFDLHAPMPGCSPDNTRSLIMQSVLKLKEATSRMDVECLLFTDLLLICKPSKRMEKYKIIKPPMRVDRIIVQDLKDKGSFLLMYMNEYHVPISAFTFHADQAAIKVWMDHIRQAQDLYSSARNVSQKNDLSFLGGELVEEEVIRTTPLHSLSETNSSTVLLSPTATQDFSEQYSPSPQPSPTGRITPDSVQKSVTEKNTQSHSNHSNSVKDKSSADTEGHHRVVQSSYSVPSFSDALVDEKLKVPSSSNVSSANSDSSLPDVLDENMRQKLNQRRSSRSEKRYYTADAIQELNKTEEKDSSIYKRLSWNFGTKDQNEERQNTLRNKVQSTDSIRSIHSSSGVSSTGSLHLSPDGEICEEFETNNNHGDIGTIHESHYNDEDHDFEINENDRHKSRSTTDISKLFQELSAGEVKDGISSVDITGSFDKKNYSHAQIMRMKKQLLLSSNVEASEV